MICENSSPHKVSDAQSCGIDGNALLIGLLQAEKDDTEKGSKQKAKMFMVKHLYLMCAIKA
jgi:hypothetical protein